MTQPVLPTPDAAPGLCICGRPLPVRTALRVCTPWCGLVALRRFTLAQVRDLIGGES